MDKPIHATCPPHNAVVTVQTLLYTHLQRMHLMLLQEKYLELLESGHELEALHCLRHELAPVPLHHSDKELQLLTSYMMYSDKDMLRKAAGWPGLDGGAREKLMDRLQGKEDVCIYIYIYNYIYIIIYPLKTVHCLLPQ